MLCYFDLIYAAVNFVAKLEAAYPFETTHRALIDCYNNKSCLEIVFYSTEESFYNPQS